MKKTFPLSCHSPAPVERDWNYGIQFRSCKKSYESVPNIKWLSPVVENFRLTKQSCTPTIGRGKLFSPRGVSKSRGAGIDLRINRIPWMNFHPAGEDFCGRSFDICCSSSFPSSLSFRTYLVPGENRGRVELHPLSIRGLHLQS